MRKLFKFIFKGIGIIMGIAFALAIGDILLDELTSNPEIFVGLIFIISIAIFLTIWIKFLKKNPFTFEYFTVSWDVTGKKNPTIDDLVDGFLIGHNNGSGWAQVVAYENRLRDYKQECLNKIENSKFKRLRQRQFDRVWDEANAYKFIMTRTQTRYKQENYRRIPYTVTVTDNAWACSYNYLYNRNNRLASINYECSLSDYNSKSQRKLMTPALRKEIMERDNYTCQCCGKYMGDLVGLHIDHILPIAKGGKTVKSNLQVLCSNCNGSKGTKITHIA